MRQLYSPVLALMILLLLSGWGFLVHRTTTQLAVYHLPKKLQAFFDENKDYLVKYAVRPDLRRNTDKKEGPRHFIDLEAYGDSAAGKMPLSWNRAVAMYTKDTLEKYGYVPYQVMFMKDRLTNAFHSGNRDSILFYAADIAHYIEDANVPLHTTMNHDGQLTNQKGLHSLWETTIPEIELTNYDLYSSHKATYLKHPDRTIWNAVRTAHQLLPQLFNEEREASKGFTDETKYRIQVRNGQESKSFTSDFARAYSQRLGNTINRQLLRSANMVADFWYTAWVDGGRPNLAQLLKEPWTKPKQKEWLREYRSFKNNSLLADSLLIARQKKNADD